MKQSSVSLEKNVKIDVLVYVMEKSWSCLRTGIY